MRLMISAVLVVVWAVPAFADPCEDRFAELLINGNQEMGPVRIHITQEIVGGTTSLNYHHSDGDGNGMTEMIDPAGDPWSLFLGDKMFRSDDKGKTWSYINSFDAEKSRTDMKSAMTTDLSSASGVMCGEEDMDGVSHEVVEGSYLSSMLSGGAIYTKYWVNPENGWVVKSYSHIQSGGFESKTTQLIEPSPDLVLPKPE